MNFLGLDHCEFCGRKIEDRNDTGSLCLKCYMKYYYPDEEKNFNMDNNIVRFIDQVP